MRTCSYFPYSCCSAPNPSPANNQKPTSPYWLTVRLLRCVVCFHMYSIMISYFTSTFNFHGWWIFVCVWEWFFFEGIPELFTLIDLQIYTHNCEWMRVARGCYSNEMCQTLTAQRFTINKTFSPKTGKKYTFIKNKCTQTFRWIFFSLSTNWLWTWKVYIKLMQMYMMIASESWSDLWQKIDKIRQCLWICQ